MLGGVELDCIMVSKGRLHQSACSGSVIGTHTVHTGSERCCISSRSSKCTVLSYMAF